MLSVTAASGILIIAISTLGQLCLPHLKVGNYIRESQSLPSAEVESLLHQSLDDDEVCMHLRILLFVFLNVSSTGA